MDAKALVSDLIGKPFLNGGRGPAEYDCWGLTVAAMQRYGWSLPEYHISAFDFDLIDAVISRQRSAWIELDQPQAGCVVVMRFGVQNLVNHIGTAIGDGLILHTRAKTGSVIERLNSPVFKAILRGFFLPPERFKT